MQIPRLARDVWQRSPWPEFDWLRREVDHLFSGTTDRCAEYPALNAYLGSDDVVITAELPGFDSKDIDISIVGDSLTISGAREDEKAEDGDVFLRRERFTGRFKRTLQLPFKVESDKVSATFENGVLKIALPRAESDKPKRIPVKSG